VAPRGRTTVKVAIAAAAAAAQKYFIEGVTLTGMKA
jgi:hypothetical protein